MVVSYHLTCCFLETNSPFRGNDIVATTMDQMDTAVQMTPAPGTFFGPRTWR